MAETEEKIKPVKKPKKPRPIAWVDWDGCTGCEVCIAFCPVDCMYLADSPESVMEGHAQIIVVDYEECIGCTICVKECPWDTIEMIMKEEVAEREEMTDQGHIAYGKVKTSFFG